MKTLLPYKTIMPSNLIKGKKYPVLYVFHGIGSNEEDTLVLVEELKEDFILIGVRGEYDREDGFAHYMIHGFGHPDREGFDRCIERIRFLMEYAEQTYPIDVNRRYLLGFSQGAAIAMTLGLTLGNKVRGVVALSGYIPTFVKEEYPIAAVDHVSVFISHGAYDAIYSLKEGKNSEEFFKQRTPKVQFHSYLSGHEVTLQNQKDFVKWLYEDLKK